MYTTEQRHAIYTRALETYRNVPNDEDGSPYLCDNVRRAIIDLEFEPIRDMQIEPDEALPEFFAYRKPEFTWWPITDTESRIACLQDCIAKTANV